VHTKWLALSPVKDFLIVMHPVFVKGFPYVPLGHSQWKLPGKFRQLP
jgi:hypothetical protein